MSAYAIRRVVQMIPVLFVVSLALFVLLHVTPGDATTARLGQEATQQQRAAARAELGLDRPLPAQYVSWVGDLATGDLGRSYVTDEPVSTVIGQRVPATVELGVLALALALLVGIPAGVIAALRRGRFSDGAINGLSLASLATPHFFLATLLILVFAVALRVLPASGYAPLTEQPGQNLQYMVLPAVTVALGMAAVFMRQTRTSMLRVLGEEHIRTATAMGLGRSRVVLRYGLRNAAIPVVTVIGLQVGALVSAMVLTETIFTLPGLGSMIVSGILSRDLPVVQGGVLLIVLFVLLVNLVTDLVYAWLDPRIAY